MKKKKSSFAGRIKRTRPVRNKRRNDGSANMTLKEVVAV